MMIADEAKQYIQSILDEQKAEGLRIYAVAGCCGPQIGLSLDAPEAADEVTDVNGIRLAISSDAKEAASSLTLDFDAQGEQPGLVMVGAPNCC
ncbi:adhesin [Planomicrobium sp. CPCC 101110]|uniref:adhesin n=1 Tax=Planomicrobium sp. CPCC 101110 TaxID=2599619 RepID=UPI0011B35886|nr:adhesin [Planomicrobium sp. CPCC 101110]TWT27297.1 adhesin [Planomicrobium sp. CPCC 101110]